VRYRLSLSAHLWNHLSLKLVMSHSPSSNRGIEIQRNPIFRFAFRQTTLYRVASYGRYKFVVGALAPKLVVGALAPKFVVVTLATLAT
jgi:hypothetical protein